MASRVLSLNASLVPLRPLSVRGGWLRSRESIGCLATVLLRGWPRFKEHLACQFKLAALTHGSARLLLGQHAITHP